MGNMWVLLYKSGEICNIKMSKIDNYVTRMCYEKRQNDTTVDLFLWKLNGILNCSRKKSNIIIKIVLVLQTYMLTVSFEILPLIFWFLIRSNDSVAFHNSEMHSLHSICRSARCESLQ